MVKSRFAFWRRRNRYGRSPIRFRNARNSYEFSKRASRRYNITVPDNTLVSIVERSDYELTPCTYEFHVKPKGDELLRFGE